MKVYKGQVTDNKDPNSEGKFAVYVPELSKFPVLVTLTSPYFNPGYSGFVAVPSKGSEVLITKAEGSDEYYFLNSIVTRGTESWKSNVEKGVPLLDPALYDEEGIPRRIIFKTVLGTSITFSEKISENGQDIKLELKSPLGKRLLLSDSTEVDAIALINEHGDGIRITSRETGAIPGRSIELDVNGSTRMISREGSTDVIVQDGREINLINRSTGSKANPAEPNRYGNVNIESENKDVNVTVRGEDGKIFLKSLGSAGEIQLESNGVVTIKGTRTVSLVSDANIEIKGLSINIESDTEMNIRAGTNLNIQAGAIANILGTAMVSVDAALINLNSGTTLPAIPAQPEQPSINSYGD